MMPASIVGNGGILQEIAGLRRSQQRAMQQLQVTQQKKENGNEEEWFVSVLFEIEEEIDLDEKISFDVKIVEELVESPQ